jgi:non-specific serine/threonine protein kinase
LPLRRTEFIGRADELAKLRSLLARSRVVTLTGVGGVGKTRLALQAADSLATEFGGGAWFVDLAPIAEASSVTAAVATALGLPDRHEGAVEDAIIAAARDQQALIVLDNCEHVIDAAARLTDLITQRCREVTVLATSREQLGIEGELTLVIGPLSVPATDDPRVFSELLESDAVRLFVERAGGVREGFSLTTDNGSAVGTVCRRLDGIPLAIELAAARTQSMSPQSIVEHLDQRFRLLTGGGRTALPRHQTLRAALDWSYDLLDPIERHVFARLSVFADGFTLEAAGTVAAGKGVDTLDVVDTLSRLVAKSMVLADELGATVRYRLLETLREYGADRLEDLDDTERTRRRHADHLAAFAQEASLQILGPNDSTWTRRVEAEHENVHAALSWARDHDVATLTRMASALCPFWRHQGHFRDCVAWVETALVADPSASPVLRAEIAAQAGWSAINLSWLERAHELLETSVESSAAAGEDPVPFAVLARALEALVTNRPGDARAHVEAALARARSRGERYEETECLTHAAIVIALSIEDPRALRLADEAVDVARSIGNDFLLGLALEAAGIAHLRTNPSIAIALLDESMLVASCGSSVDDQALFFRGVASLSLRQHEAAAASFDAALAHHHATGAEYYQSILLASIAALLTDAGSRPTPTQLLGCLERLRDEGRIIGAAIDLAAQDRLRERLLQLTDPDEFGARWAAGRALTLDQAVSLARAELAEVTDQSTRA